MNIISLRTLLLCGLTLVFPRLLTAQFYYYDYRDQMLDVADDAITRSEWGIYHMTNVIDDEEERLRQERAVVNAESRAVNRQNAQNNKTSRSIQARRELVQQAERINAAFKQKLEDCRKAIAAESRRAEEGARAADKAEAALMKWRDDIAAHHNANQEIFRQRGEMALFGQQILSDWLRINSGREVQLNKEAEDLRKAEFRLKEWQSDVEERERDNKIQMEAIRQYNLETETRETAFDRKWAELNKTADGWLERGKLTDEEFDTMDAIFMRREAAGIVVTEKTFDEYLAHLEAVSAAKDNSKIARVELKAAEGETSSLRGWFKDGKPVYILVMNRRGGEDNFSSRQFIFENGRLHSAHRVRKGSYVTGGGTEMESDSCIFHGGVLIGWKVWSNNVREIVDRNSQRFADEGERILKVVNQYRKIAQEDFDAQK